MSTPASAADEYRRGVDAASVVGMEVDGDADLLAQSVHELPGRERPAQAGHVLDREDVRAHLLQLPAPCHVVLERVLVACRVEDVAGVADRRFADGEGCLRTASIATFMLGR